MKLRHALWAGTGLFALATVGCGGTTSVDSGPGPIDPSPDAGGAVDQGPLDPIAQMLAMIDRERDPDYDYGFENARFVPPDGRTLLILGQTLDGINEHVESFPDEPIPAGWAAYWGVPSMDGVNTTATNETGSTHNHQELVDRFPNTVLQSGMWMVGTWSVARRTADGEFDSVIREFSTWAKSIERPIYLRIGYEFDGPHNEMEPDDYVDAYRHIVDIMREEDVENVAFVWHSYSSAPYQGYDISAWYPGDGYVDWVAVSLFGQLYNRDADPYVDAVFDFARVHRKPVMVAETSPIGGIGPDDTAAWDSWFAHLFSLSYGRNIKAISMINENWERFTGSTWADARIQNNEMISEAFFAETNQDRYLKASPELFEQLGYTP